jgi:hypothetical protein
VRVVHRDHVTPALSDGTTRHRVLHIIEGEGTRAIGRYIAQLNECVANGARRSDDQTATLVVACALKRVEERTLQRGTQREVHGELR